MNHKRFTASKAYSRLDIFIHECFPGMSRSQIAKWIEENRFQLNRQPVKKKSTEIKAGDIIDIELVDPVQKEYHPGLELKKLFEDDYLLIIEKPCGISVHPGSGEKNETILDVFKYYYPQITQIPDKDRPGIVHRLDKDTSGVLILAKDMITMGRLQKQFKRRKVHKTYLAIVSGLVRYRNGTIDAPIVRSTHHRTKFNVVNPLEINEYTETHAREAVTEYSVIFYDTTRNITFLRLHPISGRTHQIRVHLAHIGHPVLGDKIYGKRDSFPRLALHAYSIEFQHPMSKNTLHATSIFPDSLRKFLKNKSIGISHLKIDGK